MKTKFVPSINAMTAALALVGIVTISARADTITVTNTNDNGPGSLRQALAAANDGDEITFAVTGTITLTTGHLLVDKSITISGPGADNLAVDGNAKSRVFYIGSGVTVSISDLTVTNGNASGDNFPEFDGGGIFNDHAILTLTSCAISSNFAQDEGGGIYSDGINGSATLQINSTVIANNSTSVGGGGIWNVGWQGGTAIVEISDSTLTGNTGGGLGGAVFNIGQGGDTTVEITNSTLSGNSSGNGGGIYSTAYDEGTATLEVSNSTLSGNSASFGGGIFNDLAATLIIKDSTFSDNSADFGGGIENSGTMVSIGNTALKAGALGANIHNNSGTVTSFGYNLSSDDGGGYLTGPGDQIDTDPMLGPLEDNGGPTLTHALLPGSPAIDAGDPNFTPPPFYDQRGPDFFRVRNGHLDIGSFEVQAGSTPTPTPASTPTPRVTPTPRPRPSAAARPTPPPHITPVPLPPSPRPTPAPRP